MSEPENFLQRWSRRKLAQPSPPSPKQAKRQQHETDDPPTPSAAAPALHDAAAIGGDQNQAFDPANLPSIDSIDATSDVSAFLRPGVPPDLTRAALRRAWTSDPAIRDFVGLVENGWDFNNPEAMGGFGTISADEVARLASHLIGQLPEAADAGAAAKPGQDEEKVLLSQHVYAETNGIEVLPDPAQQSSNSKNDALQNNSES